MKKIIQVVQHLTPGGIEVMALEMLRLKSDDTHMLIVSLEGRKAKMLNTWSRLKEFEEHLIFLDKQPGYSAKILLKLMSIFLKHKPTAVHTHHIGPLLYAGVAARLSRVRNIIHTEHDAWHLQNKKRRILEKTILQVVRPQLVADSLSVQKSFTSFIPNIHTKIILNGIDTDKFSPGEKENARGQLNLPKDKIIVGCAGRLEKVKGQKTLVKALASLPSEYCLALAGSGSQLSSLLNLAEKLNFQDRIYFLGHQDDMLMFYRSLDVFCLPSYNEGMPLSPLEAQACNIPSVLTEVGGCKESLCPITGILVPPGEEQLMAQAIVNTHRNKISARSKTTPRDFVVNNANAKNMTSKYHTLCTAG